MTPYFLPGYKIGTVNIPVVNLGDRGFLKRYGSKLSQLDVQNIMLHARSRANLGLAAGDLDTLIAARAVLAEREDPLIYHSGFLIRLTDQTIDYCRCMASVSAFIRPWAPAFVASDPLVGSVLRSSSSAPPYTYSETERLSICQITINEEFKRIRTYKPTLVSVGGDWLDTVCVLQRHDLAIEILRQFRTECDQIGAALVLLSYCGPITLDSGLLAEGSQLVDGLAVPLNAMGVGMLPTRDEFLEWALSLAIPLIAIHPLSLGQLSPLKAFDFIHSLSVPTIVGASSVDHIDVLVKAANQVWGIDQRLVL